MFLATALSACSGYEIKNLAKSDIDMVADEFIDESRLLVRELAVKLYKRNPSELQKIPGMTIDARQAQLKVHTGPLDFAELDGQQIAPILRIASQTIEPEILVRDGLPPVSQLLLALAREHFSDQDGTLMKQALLNRAAEVLDRRSMQPDELLQLEATIFEMQGRGEEAIERLTLAVNNRPQSTEWRYQLASLLQKHGRLDLAWEHARKCVRKEPNNERFDALLRELVRARLAAS